MVRDIIINLKTIVIKKAAFFILIIKPKPC